MSGLDEQTARRALAEIEERIEATRCAVASQFDALAEQLAETWQRVAEALHAAGWSLTLPQARKHRRRCRKCHPAGNPRPLPVNGREYARRRRARIRRRKR